MTEGIYGGALPPGIPSGRCVLTIRLGTFDTDDDPDDKSELRIPTGATLTLTPNVTGPVILPDGTIMVVKGTVLTSDTGTFDFWAIDGMRSSVNPSGWNWTAVLKIDAATQVRFTFSPDSTSPTPINLGTLIPISDPQTGVATVVGRGVASISVDPDTRHVLFVMSDGTTYDAGAIPSGGDSGPSYDDTQLRALVATEQDARATADAALGARIDALPASAPSYDDAPLRAEMQDADTALGARIDALPALPTLAPVATSGQYADLTGTPAIPAAYDDTAIRGRVSSLEAVKPVLTINGTGPDAAGNVTVSGGSGGAGVQDTGWRDLTSALMNGWKPGSLGNPCIRRVASTIFLSGSLNGSAATSDTFFVLPDGWRAYGSAILPALATSSNSFVMFKVNLGGQGVLELPRSSAGSAGIILGAPWSTSNAFPTVYPGTPAA